MLGLGIGNPRGEENPYLLSFQVLWFRHHNWYCEQLKLQQPTWTDEQLFHRARQFVVATYQHILMDEWLPAWLGPVVTIPAYDGHKPKTFPSVPVEFQSAAMRFGHTLVTPGVFLRDKTCNFRDMNPKADPHTVLSGKHNIRTCNSYFNSPTVLTHVTIEEVFMGLASQRCEREDNIITEDLRGFVFGPPEFDRRDLMAINIQRGRETGLPDFQTARREYGLPEYKTFEEIVAGQEGTDDDGTPTKDRLARKLKELYNNDINNIDIWVGGILETTRNGPGALFKAILLNVFTSLREADRWWYENRLNRLFSEEEIADIKAAKLSHILKRVDIYDMFGDSLQENVFQASDEPKYCPQPFQLSQFDFANCTAPGHHDYYPDDTHPILWTLVGTSVCTLLLTAAYWLLTASKLGGAKRSFFACNPWRRHHPSKILESMPRAHLSGENSQRAASPLKGGDEEIVFGERGTRASSCFLVLGFRTAPIAHIENADLKEEAKWMVLEPRGHTIMDCSELKSPAGLNAVRYLQLRVLVCETTGNAFPALAVLAKKPPAFEGEKVLYVERTIPLQLVDAISLDAAAQLLWLEVRVGHDVLITTDRCRELFEDMARGVSGAREAVGLGAPLLNSTADVAGSAIARGRLKTADKRREEVDGISGHIIKRLVDTREGAPGLSGSLRIRFSGLMGIREEPDNGAGLAPTVVDDPLEAVIGRQELADAFRRSPNSFFIRSTFELALKLESTQKLPPGYIVAQDVVWFFRLFYAKDAFAKAQMIFARFSGGETVVSGLRKQQIHSFMQAVAPPGTTVPDYAAKKSLTVEEFARHDATRIVSHSGPLVASSGPLALVYEGEINLVVKDNVNKAVGTLDLVADAMDTIAQVKHSVSETLGLDPAEDLVLTVEQNPLRELRDGDIVAEYNIRPGSTLIVQRRRDFIKGPQLQSYPSIGGRGRAGVLEEDMAQAEEVQAAEVARPRSRLSKLWYHFIDSIVENRLLWIWLTLYFLVEIGLFVERWYTYAFEMERGGLRFIAGYGVATTRGAAQCSMFNLSLLLLMVCNHMWTYLRDTPVRFIFPIDNALLLHQVIGYNAFFFFGLHTVGHMFNFYNICTQPQFDINCYFRETFLYSDELVSFFSFWGLTTVTGFSGLLLVIFSVPMAAFAMVPQARQRFFRTFQYTHDLFLPIYVLVFVHGSARLVQVPYFHWFYLGPGVLYLLNWIVAKNASLVGWKVMAAQHLPGKVLKLALEKPPNFQFKSGQYITLCVKQIGSTPHPFTVSSAPDEEYLTINIRVVGPWTSKVYELFTPSFYGEDSRNPCTPFPTVFINGPFGEVHQTLAGEDVLVLVASGIGVTPASSILRDLLHQITRDKANEDLKDRLTSHASKYADSNSASVLGASALTASARLQPTQRSIYFYWVARTQYQFEWFTEVLRELEELAAAEPNLHFEAALFVTEPSMGLDRQLAQLDQAEVRGAYTDIPSAYTGLRARTFFARPDWKKIFRQLKAELPSRPAITVCCCGALAVSESVKEACAEASDAHQTFHCYGETF
eukprot:SM000068S20617  [mRNA]  locus=s68:648772:656521:+ [translate_table: standard]